MDVSTLLDDTPTTLLVNTGSRRGREALGTVPHLLRRAGLPRLHVVEAGPTVLDEALDRALAVPPRLLVVGGGDGTVAAAAARVAGTGTVLGVLPLGTANDFARTVEIPAEIGRAVTAMLQGRVVDVDLGRAGSRAFLNVASVGLSVGVTRMLTPRLKRRLGAAAYPVATLRALRRHEDFAVRLEFPEGDHPAIDLDGLLQVSIGNGRHFGGGNTVHPEATLDDGRLDVHAITRGRMRDHVSIARLLKDGSHVDHEQVLHVSTRSVRLHTRQRLDVNLDGELGTTTPTTFSLEPDAVHVAVPASSTAARLDRPVPAIAARGVGERR